MTLDPKLLGDAIVEALFKQDGPAVTTTLDRLGVYVHGRIDLAKFAADICAALSVDADGGYAE